MTRQQEGDEAMMSALCNCELLPNEHEVCEHPIANLPATVQPEEALCGAKGGDLRPDAFCEMQKGHDTHYHETKDGYMWHIAPTPEDETTLPALGIDIKDYNRSNGHVEFRQEELEIREAQLLAALRDLKTVLDRESASTARFDAKITALEAERDALLDELSACKETPGGCGYWREAAKQREAERDALKAELLLHVNRTLRNAVVGQETPQNCDCRKFCNCPAFPKPHCHFCRANMEAV